MKVNLVFSYLTIIILILAFVLTVYSIQFDGIKNVETFQASETIIAPNHFYDTSGSVLSDFSEDTIKNINHTIGASQVCIYEDGNSKQMECITAGELAIALDLPEYRKENVCIDEECLGYEDLQILNGDPDNKFKISHHNSSRGPVPSHKRCLGIKNVPIISCDGSKLPDGVDTLGIVDCGTDKNTYFTIHDTKISGDDILENVNEPDIVSPKNIPGPDNQKATH